MFIVHFFIARTASARGRLSTVVLDHEAHEYSREEVLEVLPADLHGRIFELRVAETMTVRDVVMPAKLRGLAMFYKARKIVVHRMN